MHTEEIQARHEAEMCNAIAYLAEVILVLAPQVPVPDAEQYRAIEHGLRTVRGNFISYALTMSERAGQIRAMSKIFHWSDELAAREGPGFFEIRDKAAPVYAPPPRPYPKILVGPGTAAGLAERCEPILRAMEQTGVMFDRQKLEASFEKAISEIERLSRSISFHDKSTDGLMRETFSQYARPVGGIAPQAESSLWRMAIDWHHSDIHAIMERLAYKRRAGLLLNLLELLGEDSRVHSPFFASGLNDEFRGELDPRALCFSSLVELVTAPDGRRIVLLHLPDLALRSLAFITGDAQLAEPDTDSTSPQHQAIRAIIFGTSSSDLADWNENFAVFHLEREIEAHREWFKSCPGFRNWVSELQQASGDREMKWASAYTSPNPKRFREEKGRLLRENCLATRRIVCLGVSDALEAFDVERSEVPRGSGRTRKNPENQPADSSLKSVSPQIVGFVGDYCLVEAPGEIAESVPDAAKQNLEGLFDERCRALEHSLHERCVRSAQNGRPQRR